MPRHTNQCKSSLGDNNPMYFPKRGRPIGEELEAQLAIGDIERAIWKWQLVSTGFVPLYAGAVPRCRRNRSGDVQHAGIEIDAGH
jgi:hypothetical protein